MRPRPPSARSKAVLKVRPGKGGSLRSRHVWKEKCNMAAASETSKARPSTSQERAPNPAMTALLAEEGECVLLLGPGQKLTFTGKCIVTCLYGSVQVLGLTINSNETPYELFSPNTQAPLTIEVMKRKKPDKTLKEIRTEAKAVLRGYLPLDCRRTIMKSFKSSCSILLMERLEDPTTSYIMTHSEYANIFFAKLSEKYSSMLDDTVLQSVGIENRDPDSGIVLLEKTVSAAQTLVDACIEEHHGCPVILVCGPQNVGKSTFNRYLINQLLNHIPSVGYLECDLGQSEFTPPGCISLLNITKPVLGPPFTHQRDVQKMVYFGDVSCEQEMERYFESVKYVITCYKREQPLIINTMGWVKGSGWLLLLDLIHLLSPSHVVQMVAEGADRMQPLTHEYVRNTPGSMTKPCSGAKYRNNELDSSDEEGDSANDVCFKASVGHELLQAESSFSGAGGTETVRCHAWILRDLAMLGYMSKLQQLELEQIIPLNSLVPYEVPFNAVALRVIHSAVAPSHIMYTANANWVGLCHILDDISSQETDSVILTQTPICDCLGFGIIRGVNVTKKVYHILTPIPPETLRSVNCLLIGNISIPHSVFKRQPGDVPYVTSEYDFSIYGSGKMKINKHLKRREHV
ncbi:PREDICTED: polynucleotide 5'-hydroxyl-kinase NOL9 [Nanorana parkeri]|uniref:polynucleotide 5'-hydroxyl-kinase NOL9 n=1 Tax=Nanorana parkeri TaxID=125878 RepID=UPI0008546B62|nr:PREDICTED: polynucleotide 5'-hydroxyl-kinase NOL9 [Nanorana parkeri]